MRLRAYQEKAVVSVREYWASGARSVLLVAPTGAGKTRMGEELISDAGRVLWVAHLRELTLQTADRLKTRFGQSAVGVIMSGEPARPSARIQVGTIQTLLERDDLPDFSCVVLDEAHHYMAEQWASLPAIGGAPRLLGLTATPERQDGKPLGDVFQRLVSAASYSELVADGYLVPARVLQPPDILGSDLAQDPLDAWAKHSEGSPTFMFCARVEIANREAKRFRDNGVTAEVIEAETPSHERDRILQSFRDGRTIVLMSVYALTEGIDIPEARTVILARSFKHVGGYLQAVGRVLRPAKDKPDAIVIDLTGATLRHGLPTQDRDYLLDGRAISGGNEVEREPAERPGFSQQVRDVELVAVGYMSGKAASPVELSTRDEVMSIEEASSGAWADNIGTWTAKRVTPFTTSELLEALETEKTHGNQRRVHAYLSRLGYVNTRARCNGRQALLWAKTDWEDPLDVAISAWVGKRTSPFELSELLEALGMEKTHGIKRAAASLKRSGYVTTRARRNGRQALLWAHADREDPLGAAIGAWVGKRDSRFKIGELLDDLGMEQTRGNQKLAAPHLKRLGYVTGARHNGKRLWAKTALT